MWRQNNSPSTPFDLLSNPTDCGEEVTNYPGTKCKGESYVCCQANYSDNPIEPIPLGDTGYEVPGTEPGADCFPALVCTFGFEGGNRVDISVCTTKGQRPEDPAVHYYVDANGYVWLAIISYELFVGDTEDIVQPHWVTIFKSTSAIDCSVINANYMEGQSFSFTEVCNGLALGSVQCEDEIEPLVDLSSVSLTLTLYNKAVRCCDIVGFDPCNDDEGLCGSDVNCPVCLNGVSSNRYLIEIESVGDGSCECTFLNGSYILESYESGILYRCCSEHCFDVDFSCNGVEYKSVRISGCFGTLFKDPADPTTVYGWSGSIVAYTGLGCTGLSPLFLARIEWNSLKMPPSQPDLPCLDLERNRMTISNTSALCGWTNARAYITTI
jgi:hypothetical protein